MVTWDGDQIIFAAVGGIILGIATSINYILRGKVTGMSGIIFGIVSLNKCTYSHEFSRNSRKAFNRWRHVFGISYLLLRFSVWILRRNDAFWASLKYRHLDNLSWIRTSWISCWIRYKDVEWVYKRPRTLRNI